MTDAVSTPLGFALFAGAALLAFSALFGNGVRLRLRGGRQCPRCGYDLSHNDTMTCSECGRTSKRARTFTRGRRRWRWVSVALLIACGAHVVQCAPEIQERGWIAAVPSSVLVFTAPVGEEAWKPDDVGGANCFLEPVDQQLIEALRRLEHAELTAWQRQRLMQRILDADPAYWRWNYGFQTRRRWPAGSDITVSMMPPLWTLWTSVEFSIEREITIRARLSSGRGDWAVWHHGRGPFRVDADGILRRVEDPVRFGLRADDADEVTFDVEFWRDLALVEGERLDLSPGTRLWAGRSPVVRRGGTAASILSSVDQSEVGNDDIVQALDPRLHLDLKRMSVGLVVHDPAVGGDSLAEPVLVGAHVDVKGDGDLVARGELLVVIYKRSGRAAVVFNDPSYPSYPLNLDEAMSAEALRAIKSWEICLTGDADIAIQGETSVTRYWSGTWCGAPSEVIVVGGT